MKSADNGLTSSTYTCTSVCGHVVQRVRIRRARPDARCMRARNRVGSLRTRHISTHVIIAARRGRHVRSASDVMLFDRRGGITCSS